MPGPRSLHQQDRAFTATELVVAVAIVFLLLAILLGVLPRVRISSKAIVNIRHHQTIATALLRYAQDHQGSLPYSYQDTSEIRSMTYPRELMMKGYLNNPEVFFSPLVDPWFRNAGVARNMAEPQRDSVIPWYYTNYSANRNGAMPYRTDTDGTRRPANINRVASDGNLSRLILLRDSYEASWDNPDQDDRRRGGGRVWFSSEGYLPPEEKSYHDKIHVSFADGHVEAFSREDILPLLRAANREPPLFNELYTR